MTNKNSSWNNQPFLLKPAGKDYLWGGRRLKDDFSKDIDMSPLAETWECSTHPDGFSLISGGPFDGQTLRDVLKRYPAYAGSARLKDGDLPVLIKLIDAKEDLSVQVHPDDDYARVHEEGVLGKTEMWYVLDAAPNARLVYGFNRSMDKNTLKKALDDGSILKYLQYIPIRKNDIFCIEPGTVHAIGAGALIAEIQENSNLTYRMYDYNRTDKNGQKRPLQPDKALDVVNLCASQEPRQPLRILRYSAGCASEFLYRCKYFQAERMLINTERQRQMADCPVSAHSFQVLLCTEGCGVLFPTSGNPIPFLRGDCIFVPAECSPCRLHGNAQFLKISC